uniref:O-GlcNAc transferase C-terminal domain-containing protein n=2 Tax=Zea mays TaxID=4577 RepID=A0A804NQY5_MAIZE
MFIHCCPLIYAILQRGCCRNLIYGRRKCSSVAFRVVCGTRSVTNTSFPFVFYIPLFIGSRKYAAHYSLIYSRFRLPPFVHPPPIPVKAEGKHCRLKVGYVSSDFGNHPLSHLMGSVFGMYDRANIEVFCYALSQNDGTEWRQRIRSEAEHFVDVSAMTSDNIAELINQDKIQILINLNGYTKDSDSHQVTPPPHDDFADRCLNSSGGATNNNSMSRSRAMELMFELVN